MQMIKKQILFFFAFGLTATAIQANEVLMVQSANGEAQSIELEKIDKISFVNNEMAVSVQNETYYFILADLDKLIFDELSEIELPETSNIELSVHITPSGDVLVISSMEVLSLIVYDINGRRLFVSDSDQLNVATLAAGIYLLQVETAQGIVIKKFIKK